MEQQKPKANGEKIGRNARRGQAMRYKAEGRHFKNKKRKLQRHLKRYPEDKQAATALDAL